MKTTLRNFFAFTAVTLSLFSNAVAQDKKPAETKPEWIVMNDGKTFDGWKMAEENQKTWTIEKGAFVAHGDRCHLFYVGDGKAFTNFEFQAEVMTKPNSNGGIYFHTQYQAQGWPKYGFEAQVNNSYAPDPIKTGSLYQVVNMQRPPAKDNEWFKYNIKVQGNRAVVKINGVVVVDYTQPEGTKAGQDFTRVFEPNGGTFALQAHDPGSEVHYRKMKVRRLP